MLFFPHRPRNDVAKLLRRHFRGAALEELAVAESHSYRGKVLSLEMERSYTGQSTGIKVHRLGRVLADQVILPDKTRQLLDRNVIQFVRQRQKLAAAGQPTRKGLLFYGPPGT